MKYHKRFTKTQIKLWEKVRDAILAEPKAYDQDVWATSGEPPSCATPTRIGGWTEFFLRNTALDVETGLGLKGEEGYKVLMAGGRGWKPPFNVQFAEKKTPRGKASVAGRYLNSVITTGEV